MALGVVLMVASGKIDIEFWSSSSDNSSAAISDTPSGALSVGSDAGLGEGVRTAADVRWIRRMDGLCSRRNAQENALGDLDNTTQSLARYAAQTRWIWDNYQRRASSVHAPTTYAAEDSWFRQVDEAKRQAIQNVLETAQQGDESASQTAINEFAALSSYTYRGLAKIGVADCAEFSP
jgi:uncharacterized protein (DUF342 family)